MPASDLEMDQRLRIIVEMITGGTFKTGKSNKELADLWGVSEGIVQRAVAEAVRYIRLSQGDLDDIIERKLAGIEDIRTRALAVKDWKAALEADRLYLSALGARLMRRPDSRGPLAEPTGHQAQEAQKLRQLSPAERIALLEEAIAEERAAMANANAITVPALPAREADTVPPPPPDAEPAKPKSTFAYPFPKNIY